MRALVISDTHFGAWTGEDLLCEAENLAVIEPQLDVDEVILLGDMLDFLFSPLRRALMAAGGLFDLLRDKLQGKKFVFLAGNHDHHLVAREAEEVIELALGAADSAGGLPDTRRGTEGFRRLLERRLEGVQVEIHYPTYTFADVLCTHGHYLDLHARRVGSFPSQLFGRVIWSVSVGRRHAPTLDDYEATTQLLTGMLFTIAQLPNGTHAQRRVYRTFQSLERAIGAATSPARAVEQLAHRVRQRASGRSEGMAEQDVAAYDDARTQEQERRRRAGAPSGGEAASYALARRVRPSDPVQPAVEAFEQVVTNLGWARDTDKIVFAHTHQPLDGVLGPSGRWRYWNTGSWIYEPDLSSRRAYTAYLRNAWPGTAVLIDSDAPEPRLLRLRGHLNPITRGTFSE
ncbi:MAG: metallophosphoesterase [Solirubrobacterales bacterium]|nr:metallophosphoesterase [Solirubrobacterales bacterium]